MTDKPKIKGRAKRKQITQSMSIQLAEIARERGNKAFEKKYWNTYHCLNHVLVAKGRKYGKYCKNRSCLVCSCIREAVIMNHYFPVIKQWKEPHFVTLTVKAVPAYKLKALMKNMLLGMNKIINKHKKRNQRGKGIRLIGIRSLECNFNPITKTYNPHFHLIVPDRETGDIFIEEWLTRPLKRKTKTKWTIDLAQKNLKIRNLEKCLMEVVKYSTKIFNQPDGKNKIRGQSNRKVYIRAIYNILEAMEGERIFDRFGFNLPKNKSKEKRPAILLTDFKEYFYDLRRTDWIENGTDLQLTQYVPDHWVNTILQYCIDVKSS